MAASPEGVALQTVKLKVLYTFDAEQKDNHLARWPHSLDVQTCFLDPTTQIGVVDLRSCLEAVTTASPELITKLDNDYAIYAYDYSEEDTPLVGQGMLSKTLASQDEIVGSDNQAMITGRISKNMTGLFSKNVQPTLEVKLRLTPVATLSQQRMRSGSISSQDARQPQWSQAAENLGAQSLPRSATPLDAVGIENVQRMLSEGGPPRDRTASFAVEQHYNAYNSSRPPSRPGTPTLVPAFNPSQRPLAPRPDSRAAVRQSSHARRDSFNSGYFSGDENADDGPARKRVKATKVDLPSKSNYNIDRQPDSLRVVASTASSVRLHRPVAINPTIALQTSNQAEEPVRPPTPIPSVKAPKPRGRPKKTAGSNLAHAKQARESSPVVNPSIQPNLAAFPLSSPEDVRAHSVSSTPANIPSSPPVMLDQQQPLITSPSLPPIHNNPESGYMSGGNFDIDPFGEGEMMDFDPNMDFNKLKEQLGQDFVMVFDEGSEIGPPIPTNPPREAPHMPLHPPLRPLSRAQSYNPAPLISMSSPRLAPAPIPRARQILEEQRAQAQAMLPQIPASDPVGRTLQRSKTWAPDMSDALISEAPEPDGSKPKSKKKVGKEQTKARLENAIATGAPAVYCDNCGAIETPAWRRGYTKTFTCKWEEVETGLDYGACVFKEVVENNDDGSVKAFKGYKVEKLAGDEADGWVQISLCNPCGLWFHKQKCPRPREKWDKKGPYQRRKRKRAPKGPKAKNAAGTANGKSDGATPASDESSPADTATEAPDGDDGDDGDDNDNGMNAGEDELRSKEPGLPPMSQNMRASSAEPTIRGLRSHTHHKRAQREVQSSPARLNDIEGAPIEIDLTPRPLRRQLFPSPAKDQIHSHTLRAMTAPEALSHLPAFVRRSPRLNKTEDIFQLPGVAGAVAITADGKENIMPTLAIDEELDSLFNAVIDGLDLPPTTPTPRRRSERIFLNTPHRQFGLDMSPNLPHSPTFRTPKRKQGPHPIAAALLGTIRKDVAEMTPFSRSIHEALSDARDFEELMTPAKAIPPNHNTRSVNRATPTKVAYDFPDLPSLKNSSPMNSGALFNFDFSDLTADQLNTDMDIFNTDAPMPSSPPPGFYNFINADDGEDKNGL